MVFFWAAILRDSVSLFKFPFCSHFQVFSWYSVYLLLKISMEMFFFLFPLHNFFFLTLLMLPHNVVFESSNLCIYPILNVVRPLPHSFFDTCCLLYLSHIQNLATLLLCSLSFHILLQNCSVSLASGCW